MKSMFIRLYIYMREPMKELMAKVIYAHIYVILGYGSNTYLAHLVR